jgi:hypothetical protein
MPDQVPKNSGSGLPTVFKIIVFGIFLKEELQPTRLQSAADTHRAAAGARAAQQAARGVPGAAQQQLQCAHAREGVALRQRLQRLQVPQNGPLAREALLEDFPEGHGKKNNN